MTGERLTPRIIERVGKSMNVKKYEMRVNENSMPYLVMVGETDISDAKSHRNSKAMAKIFRRAYHIDKLSEEHIYMMAFDKPGDLIGLFELSRCTGQGHVINPAQTMQCAMLAGAASICIARNCHSDDVFPLAEDRKFAAAVEMAARVCRIKFYDYMLVAGSRKDAYYSFRLRANL